MLLNLKKIYFIMLIPALIDAAVSYFIVSNRVISFSSLYPSGPFPFFVILFILSVSFALPLPILYRAFFAHQMRKQKTVSQETFYLFEKRLLIIAMISPYITGFAVLAGIVSLYLYGSVIASLYAVYYFYPSEKRIALDKRIFRVPDEMAE